jgi:hypothetical protein
MEILISTIIGLALIELYAWLGPLAKWLVHQVAKRLPEARRADFVEQFTADLETLPNSIAKVLFAFRDCTLAARNIYENIYRETLLSLADRNDAIFGKLTLLDHSIATSKAQTQTNFQPYLAFISAMDNSLEALRRSQRQDDPDAEAAIHQFETLCSPIVGTLSTIQTKTAQKFAKIGDLSDRLREPLARLFEVNENVRRRAHDDKPIDDSDFELASSLQKRIDVIMAIIKEYKTDFDSSAVLPIFLNGL